MRTVKINELLDVLASNGIQTIKLENALYSQAMPNSTELASSILNNLYNFAHYALNTSFKKNEANIKKFVELIVACYKSKNDRDLLNIKNEYTALCNKLPAQYRSDMTLDYTGSHVETIKKYVEAYVLSLEALKNTPSNAKYVEIINEAIEILKRISSSANLLWDTSSEQAVAVLEKTIVAIQVFGKDCLNNFFVRTKLKGIIDAENEILNLNVALKAINYQVKPTNKINTSLIVSGEICDEFSTNGKVDERLIEYREFKNILNEKADIVFENEEMKQLKAEIQSYKTKAATIAAERTNGLYIGTNEDFIYELKTLQSRITQCEEKLRVHRETLRSSGENPLILEFEKLRIKIDNIANKDLRLLHTVIKDIDFSLFVPIIRGVAYSVSEELINDITYMNVALDEIFQGNMKSTEKVKGIMSSMNERYSHVRTQNQTPTQTQINVQEQEQKKKKEEEEIANLLKGLGLAPSVDQTTVSTTGADENPVDQIVNASGLFGND